MAIPLVIVGMGSRGRDWLREVTSSNAFEVAACVDSDEQALKESCDQFQFPSDRRFVTLKAAIERVSPQAAIVATPADDHVEPCREALQSKLGVLVEKPFTMRLSEAAELVALAARQNRPLLVAQNYRYLRSFRTVKRLIADGTLGPIRAVTCQYFRPPHEMARSLERLPHSILYAMSVHHLDALRYVLGQEALKVIAESYTSSVNSSLSGASFRAMLRFDGGAQAIYSATYESSGHQFFERGQEFYARFTGHRGTLHVFHRWLIFCENGKFPRVVRRGRREMSEEQELLRQLQQAMATGERSQLSGRDNLQTMAILEACVRSAEEQRWISPQELLNELQ
jgi:predicted dehydrogenase